VHEQVMMRPRETRYLKVRDAIRATTKPITHYSIEDEKDSHQGKESVNQFLVRMLCSGGHKVFFNTAAKVVKAKRFASMEQRELEE
jgi:hypothetical protein